MAPTRAQDRPEGMTDEESRKSLLQTADTWDWMAAYEDKHNPPRPVRGIS